MNIIVGYPPSKPCQNISSSKAKSVKKLSPLARLRKQIRKYLNTKSKTRPIDQIPANFTLNPSIYVFDQKLNN